MRYKYTKMVQMEFFIKPAYADLLPRQTTKDYERLKKSIKTQGLLNPITINQNNIVLDGHNRLRVCHELSIPVEYIVKNFQDKPLDELKFVITVNLNRRQFDVHERAQIALKLNKVYKATDRLMTEWRKFNHSSHSSDILPTLTG
jgi:ParB/RepB/Spo0J family partition protein